MLGYVSPRFKHGLYSKDVLSRMLGEREHPEAWAGERAKRERRAARARQAAAVRMIADLTRRGRRKHQADIAFLKGIAAGALDE